MTEPSTKVTTVIGRFQSQLDSHGIQVKIITNELNGITASKIFKDHRKRPIFLIAERTPCTNVAFGLKTSNSKEDIMILYRESYLCFIYDTELEEAIDAFSKILN